MLTKQQLFDRVAKHLLVQKAPAIRPGGSDCAYRGVGGLKCAVGCLIDDAHYSTELEGKLASDFEVREAVELSLGQTLNHVEVALLRGLQNLHDDMVVPAQMPHRLALLAKQHRLEWKGVEALLA